MPTDSDNSVPTLEDVAARAGVSTATVSRCLNAPGLVSQKTRDKVMQAVRDLGYAPNFGARALAARRTNTFGAVIPTMDNAIFARALQAFQEVLADHGVMLLVASSSYSPELEEDQIRALVTRGAEALLLIGHDRTPQAYAFLEKQQLPFVIGWTHVEAEARLSVGFDNHRAMALITREALALGHRRLGMISAKRTGNDRARARYDGVCAAMLAAGLDPATLAVEETHYAVDDGAEAFGRLMALPDRPTAVLCGNDVLAAGAVLRARQLGLAVPQDVSITGFDDMDLADIVVPPLTTVHVPHKAMGQQAAEVLLALRNGEAPERGPALETHIHWRQSLGPAPQDS